MSDLAPIQHAHRASKAAAAADKKDPHSDATKDAHGEAHQHWLGMAQSTKDQFYKDHYSAMAKHHFNRSYGRDSKSPYRVERKDLIPGGLADKSEPGDFDPKQLAMGIASEMEHTSSKSVAREIAMDHLKEDPRYYTKLKKIHKESAMGIHEMLGLLEEVRDSLEEMTSVKATGATTGKFLPGVTDPSKKTGRHPAANDKARRDARRMKKASPVQATAPTPTAAIEPKKKKGFIARAISRLRGESDSVFGDLISECRFNLEE